MGHYKSGFTQNCMGHYMLNQLKFLDTLQEQPYIEAIAIVQMESDERFGEYEKCTCTKEWASAVIKGTQISKEIWGLYKVLSPKASHAGCKEVD